MTVPQYYVILILLVLLVFKIMYFKRLRWSALPKHVAYIDETNKTVFWLTAVRMPIFSFFNSVPASKYAVRKIPQMMSRPLPSTLLPNLTYRPKTSIF